MLGIRLNYIQLKHSQLILFSFFIFLLSPVKGADSLKFFNDLHFSAGVSYGIVTPHTSSIDYMVNAPITGFQFLVKTNSYGHSYWDKLYRYPSYGIGYFYTTLGNKQVYGSGNALFLFLDIPFVNADKKFSTSYRFNLGLGYVNTTYNIETNLMNLAISSHFNVYFAFSGNFNYHLNSKNELFLTMELGHFSNGKFESPNMGINLFNFKAGYTYRLQQPKYKKGNYSLPVNIHPFQYETLISTGLKSDDQLSDSLYSIVTCIFDAKYNFTPKYAVGIGIDGFYDAALGPNKAQEVDADYKESDLFQLGLHGGFWARYGRLTGTVNVGTYLVANYYQYSRMYFRLGIRYQLFDRILLGIGLKTHYANADYIEWGLGYRFN